jgi:hypothetical protein
VIQGKIATAAGVSAGIDMALTLAARIVGDAIAQAIQLSIEYDPQPSFDSGSVAKAAPSTVQLVRSATAGAGARAVHSPATPLDQTIGYAASGTICSTRLRPSRLAR